MMYHVTVHRGGLGAGSEDDDGDVLFMSNVEAVAWAFYSTMRPDPGTVVSLWRSDDSLMASKTGPRAPLH
jgi:hypothetical protein